MDQDECHRWGEVRSLRSDSAVAVLSIPHNTLVSHVTLDQQLVRDQGIIF